MAKVKFSLDPNPTFKGEVKIPVAGDKPGVIEFIFTYRDRDELAAFTEKTQGREDWVNVMDMASGWDLDDPWGEQSVKKLLVKYHGAAMAIYEAYYSELFKGRQGN